MHATDLLSAELLELLQHTDTCTISNAIESLDVRMRDEGYVQTHLQCLLPNHPPVAGYAVTGRIRTSAPPIANLLYYHRTEWWEYLERIPSPKIMAIADVDRAPGMAAFVGEIHGEICRALGCVAYVSNGAIRDVPALERMGFQCLSGGVSVSHAYAHLVDWEEPIEIGCLKIKPGDILQADRHGVLSIPRDSLPHLEEATRALRRRETELIKFCRAPGFSVERLIDKLGRDQSCSQQNQP